LYKENYVVTDFAVPNPLLRGDRGECFCSRKLFYFCSSFTSPLIPLQRGNLVAARITGPIPLLRGDKGEVFLF
jgi:hypothetical protein